jgi:DNA-binding transcriptional regulator LsrR (DeoR family)
MADDEARSAYLAYVASLYYDQGKTQKEISDEIGITRSAISRLLTEAREKGIVEIIVHYPWRTSAELENELVSTFGLKAARVLRSEVKSYEEMLQGLGVLAAEYLDSILRDGVTIGISWGSALYQMIQAMRSSNKKDVEVVQLLGATGTEGILTDGPILARLLANHLGATCRFLHSPLLVDSKAGRDALLADRTIQDTLKRARNSDINLVGIGTTEPQFYSLLRSGYVTEDETKQIMETGAIGDICGRHYDAMGKLLDIDVNHRVIGVGLEDVAKAETVIGVAGGEVKAVTILGALRGQYINVLVTDESAARQILRLHHERD